MIHIDQIIRSRRKTISLTLQRDGKLIVHAPLRTREEVIRELVQQKEAWIRAKQLIQSTYPPYTPKAFINGESFWYLGNPYPLEIVQTARPALRFKSCFHLAQSALPQARQVFERWYRKQAAQIFSERTAALAAQHSFTYQQLRISTARTRWGSCSSRGTISFAWRLVMAPLPVIDYVVVHELVHTQIKNHSRQFWNAVQSITPDYKQHRQWLAVNGHLYNLD